MPSLSYFVVTPPGLPDSSLAIAACRAGACGLLDLEFTSAGPALQAPVERLERFATGPFGIKIGPDSEAIVSQFAGHLPSGLAWVLLGGGDHPTLAEWVSFFRRHRVRLLFEAVSMTEALLAERLVVDGLVLKGHEAGGRVGPETSFILLQRWCRHRAESKQPALPVWVQGGIGFNTAAACVAAGAAGVVLDAQLLLARESPLPHAARLRLATFDGSETLYLGEQLGEAYRMYARPGVVAVEELRQEEERLRDSALSPEEKREAWRQTVRQLVGSDPDRALWLLGQDAAMAKPWADRFGTVGGMLQALTERVDHHLETAARLKPLREGALLAQRHGTRYPIVQGPMTRVSDVASFADAVAQAGALPFLALALLRKAETETLLRETAIRLTGRSWGVGILGFVPPEIRQEQIEAIRIVKPPFALIAGGRPDQARELEKEGIPTYLHVPSPGLLRMFLRDGARRFVFEGRECGGHVGPRTSFVLWDVICEVLLEHLGPNGQGDDLHVIFAGGIHDALSAAMVGAMASSLAERGVAVGVLMGTAYLFTEEAVTSGAIVPRFQQEAVGCGETVLLESGPGHAIRCLKTPYFDQYESEKRRLQQEGRNHEEIRKALERMNIGRLRVASKGLDRAADNAAARFVTLADEEQYARGMYMIGQVACLRDRVVTMQELHQDVCNGSTRLLEAAARPMVIEEAPKEKPCDVAIIGMACFYPKAGDVWAYWENILNKVNAVEEIPPSHWDWRLYYDPNPRARDKIISKWGGFLDDIAFDPLVYGITPNSLRSIEPLQLFLLEAVRRAVADAGYTHRPFNRERTAAILGIGGGGSPLAVAYGFRTCLPLLDTVPDLPMNSGQVLQLAESMLPEWTEDSFPGILLNVAVGRVANRFNFGGPNYSIDAACGSSLAALHACVRELEMGTSDVAVAMGADTVQTPYAYMAFSKTHALSPRGRCRPFDAAADGIALSEGIGAVILKRLADAERDGDKIYAVIKGMGASSDGRDKGLTAPRPEGQMRALRRAYAKAGLSPARLGLVEAHGTGTVAGDQTEAQALGQIFLEAGAEPQSCALGSVKSMIGHSKCAAGIAGLIKTTLALHHKVLPPTLVERPNPKGNFEEGPLFLNTEARPWVHGTEHPRYAGVSAFGFGGTNFHVVLEEYANGYLAEPTSGLRNWPAELLIWCRPTRAELREAVSQCHQALVNGARPHLGELAWALWREVPGAPADRGIEQPTLAIVASSLDDLKEKLPLALEELKAGKAVWNDPRGLYFAEQPADQGGQVAFLFPGQGSQYPNMLAQTALVFPEVRQAFDQAERSLAGQLERPLGRFIFPPSPFAPEKEQEARQALMRTDVAQPAVGAASLGMFHLLTSLGVEPDFLAGHSYGEYGALCAAGALTEDELIRLSHRRGRVIVESTQERPGTMAALDAGAAVTEKLVEGLAEVTVANLNAPNQTVISGTEEGIRTALERAQKEGVRGQQIPVACGFHSTLVTPAREPLALALAVCSFMALRRPVFSNTTAKPYPAEPSAMATLLADHLTSPVRFQAEVEAMYEAGARLFIEVGPQGVLTGLVHQILADRPHLAAASDLKGRPGLVQLEHLLAQLLVHGVPVQLTRLFLGRDLRVIDLAKLDQETGTPNLTASTWMVNSVRNRPLNAPEPRLLGQLRASNPSAPKIADAKPTSSVPGLPAMNPSERPVANGVTTPVGAAAPPTNGTVHPVSTVPNDEAAHVMLRFQDMMARFLDTQKSVMMSYLQSGSAATPSAAVLPLSPAAVLPLSPTNGHAVSIPPPEPAATTPPTAPVPEGSPAANGAAAAQLPSVVLDRAWLSAQLLDLVSKRTGYPKEMLGLDLDLEADLGIDSIKRVEILGGLADSMGGTNTGLASNLEMEKLTGLKTLRGILDYLDSVPGATKPAEAQVPAANGQASNPARQLEVQRALVKLVDAPLPAQTSVLLPSGTLLVTDDGQGVARELIGRLADFGQKAALIRMGTATEENGQEIFAGDLTSPQAVTDLLERIRCQLGSIAGLIHLLPLAQPPAEETATDRLRREVKALYLLARSLGDDLRHSGQEGGAVLLAATALGGSLGFGTEPLPQSYFAGHGGIVGFVKCLAFEWPEVLVRVVDLDPGKAAVELADRLLSELGDPDGPLEVGYAGTHRVTWEPYQAPLDTTAPTAPLLDKESTVLITGGARGITAAVGLELARRYQPNLVLAGRSLLPEEAELPETASLTAPAEIKAALIARFQREGRPIVPAAVEAAYQRLMHDREIRNNLERLRQAGARVHYYQVDVRDEQALTGLLDDIERRFGNLDGVIHGAGVIEDKLVRDKTPESFDRVFGTKSESALVLSRHLKPERLKFCVFFASIASRYGNKGQSDYAAANEMLSKLAIDLDRRWPCRVVSVAWGPWASVGMVADLEKHLTQRGLKLITPEEGPVFLVEELLHGRKGNTEVIIAGGAEHAARPARSSGQRAVAGVPG
jgi:acyl transferase domain-containing protein/NAD(P)H-dependent flavin oxidoreductase YrpB (nitropropane dioxygenase family)/NAD(P)-dependent dehydrogenase (short-subunit alcohol dehydrogenase family)